MFFETQAKNNQRIRQKGLFFEGRVETVESDRVISKENLIGTVWTKRNGLPQKKLDLADRARECLRERSHLNH
jgi:hypothetical protein